jgi:U3 small nucleolar RNA-associated protein 14
MKFMKNADAARKERNDAELRQLNRELHGEESVSDAESEVGRRKFGQSKNPDAKSHAKPLPKNEFEEKLDSDDEAAQVPVSDDDVDIAVNGTTKHKSGASGNKKGSRSSRDSSDQQKDTSAEEENPWLIQTERTNRRRTGPDAQESIDISLDATQPEVAPAKQQSKKQKNAKATLAKQQFEENDSDDEEKVPVLLKNHDLVKRAFAGDEVVQEFEQDKMDTVEDEGDQVVDNTLPGWGSWAGEGVSKRQQKKQKKDLTVVAGVKAHQRKDAKLDRVIINQKRVQKVSQVLFLHQHGQLTNFVTLEQEVHGKPAAARVRDQTAVRTVPAVALRPRVVYERNLPEWHQASCHDQAGHHQAHVEAHAMNVNILFHFTYAVSSVSI